MGDAIEAKATELVAWTTWLNVASIAALDWELELEEERSLAGPLDVLGCSFSQTFFITLSGGGR